MSSARQPARPRAHPAARRPGRRGAGGGHRPRRGRRRPPHVQRRLGGAGRGGARRTAHRDHGVRLRPHRLPPRAGPAAAQRLEGLRAGAVGARAQPGLPARAGRAAPGRRGDRRGRRGAAHARRSWPTPTRPPPPRSGSGSRAGAAPAGAAGPGAARASTDRPGTGRQLVARTRRRLDGALRRLRTSALPIVQCGLAAGAAWLVAHDLVGHERPFFAPIAAVISLGVSLANRLRRAVELVVGVSLGVLVGDLLISVIGSGWWQITLVVILAVAAAVFADGGRCWSTRRGRRPSWSRPCCRRGRPAAWTAASTR